MSELHIEDKQIVVPGDELAVGMDYLPSAGTMRDKEAIVATRVGMAKIDGKVLKIVPLTGEYVPKRNDTVIGQVEDINYSGWNLNVSKAYNAMLSISEATSEYIPKGADLSQYYDIGDYVVIKITNVTSQKLVDVTAKGPGLRKLRKGRMITVNSNKVPRIIGKQGSMVTTVKKYTDTQIVVGQNGVVWIYGEDPQKETLAEQAVKKIEAEAHISGLTETMEKWLESEAKKLGAEK